MTDSFNFNIFLFSSEIAKKQTLVLSLMCLFRVKLKISFSNKGTKITPPTHIQKIYFLPFSVIGLCPRPHLIGDHIRGKFWDIEFFKF